MTRSTNRSKKSRVNPPNVPDEERKGDETPDVPKSKLPPELWRNIVEEVALSIPDAKARNHALYYLLLTSRDLHSEARRLLYRDITFVHGTPVAGKISDALHAGAAKYVRSMRAANLVGEVGRRGRSAKTHFSHLPLNSMRALRSLDLSASWIQNPSELVELIRCSIPCDSLVAFHVLLSFDDDILPFLLQQKNIQFLSLYRFDDEPTSPPQPRQLLPNLKRFKLHDLNRVTNNFQGFMKDRPITVFHSGSFFRLPDFWSTFARQLQALDLSSSQVNFQGLKEFLEVIATTAINLRLFACAQISTFQEVAPATIPAVFCVLNKLHHLEAFTVSFTSFTIGELDITNIPNVVSDFGTPTQVKSILLTQRTVLGHGGETVLEFCYTPESGWTTAQKYDLHREDWFETWLRKLDMAYC
ncbi:hypothetical protein SISNIDRAFT_551130 [Sistotremastrum niveocremeum HHB9708]|uniref:F-box domain-containing protein n=1 Tax=Sistotremastrum niveocremeum HHB9708 TaxID=1314777 RepID=A0A164SCJ6_9AGAM|nr:hypothetical protein SISNIDRAFT_551130 [Sistotremastrum niveocremeum HHB9708]